MFPSGKVIGPEILSSLKRSFQNISYRQQPKSLHKLAEELNNIGVDLYAENDTISAMELFKSAAKAMLTSMQPGDCEDVIIDEMRTEMLSQMANGKRQLHQLKHSASKKSHIAGLDSYQWSETDSELTPKCLSEALKVKNDESHDKDENVETVTSATIMYNIGLVHMKNKDFDHVNKVFDLAMKLRPTSESKSSYYGAYVSSNALVFAALYNNIGYFQHKKGSLNEAKETFMKAAKIGYMSQRQCDDIIENYRHLGTIQFNIGIINAKMGLVDEAMTSFDCSLGIQMLALGETHPDMPTLQHNIGMVYFALGKIDDAMSAFLESLRMIRFALGNDHFLVAKELFHIGKIHELRGDYDEALHVYEETLRVERLTLGTHNSDTLETLYVMAQTHLNKGNLNASINVYNDALIVAKSIGSERAVVSILIQMIKVHLEDGNISEAIKIYGEATSLVETNGIDNGLVDTVEFACINYLLINHPAAAAA